MKKDLIYDVGMNNGSDTAYYLARGFKVVAIEANPILAQEACTKYASEIASGRLTILNVGIAAKEGVAPFWVNDKISEWSSFDRAIGGRDNTPCHCIDVPCVNFRDVLRQYGVPFYLKVDIEGNDILCLQDLTPGDTPTYISVEAHKLEYLCILHQLGYTAFKCINQLNHNDPLTQRRNNEKFLSPLAQRFGQRLPRVTEWLASVPRRTFFDHVGLLKDGKAILPPRPSSTKCREEAAKWEFPSGSSGPFGEETYGEWEDLETVAYNWLHYKFGRKDRGSLNMFGWYDFHAKKTQ